jgi:hypothetical protein
MALNTYKRNTCIGNWNEDRELNSYQTKQFLQKRANGELLVTQVQNLLNSCLQEVEPSYSADGFVHFGDTVMVYSVATDGVLSVDMSTKVVGDEGYCMTTSTRTQASVARNCFVIEPRPGDHSAKMGDVLKLNQIFRLRSHEKLGAPGYVVSQPVSSQSCARKSRFQEVSLSTTNTSADSYWMVVFKDVDERFEREGEHVPANAELVFKHVQTNAALASETKFQHLSDFGAEFEVSAKTHNTINKKQGLQQEQLGQTTPDIDSRPEQKQNHFAFLTATAPLRAETAAEDVAPME